jgi:hypothetical protein
MRALLSAACLAVALTGPQAPAIAASPLEAPGVRVAYDDVSEDAARWLLDQLVAARGKIERYWGKTYDGPLTVRVTSERRIAMSLVPAWRGERGSMIFPSRGVARARTATLHEVVHVYAPNQNRFLAEGLAVYLHQRLGGPVAYPNFGRALDRIARRHRNAPLHRLDAIATPTRLELPGELDGREAYIVAGAFVGFLIERYGLTRFRRLYAMTPLVPRQRGGSGALERYHAVYGKAFDQLVAEWRAELRRRRRRR